MDFLADGADRNVRLHAFLDWIRSAGFFSSTPVQPASCGRMHELCAWHADTAGFLFEQMENTLHGRSNQLCVGLHRNCARAVMALTSFVFMYVETYLFTCSSRYARGASLSAGSNLAIPWTTKDNKCIITWQSYCHTRISTAPLTLDTNTRVGRTCGQSSKLLLNNLKQFW